VNGRREGPAALRKAEVLSGPPLASARERVHEAAMGLSSSSIAPPAPDWLGEIQPAMRAVPPRRALAGEATRR